MEEPTRYSAGIELSAHIVTVRGRRVILDSDLAQLHGVTTKRLNEPVPRNPARFPKEFAFALSAAPRRTPSPSTGR